MSIVFVDPPSPPGFVAFRHSHGGFGENCRTSRLRLPTLDLFHCASSLLERGLAASVVDSVLEGHSPEDCRRAILARDPSLVVLRTSSYSCPHDLRLAEGLRRDFPGPLILFGPQAGVEAEALLASPAVDAVVPALDPSPFLDLARGRGLDRAAGVWHKRGAGVVRNKPAPGFDPDRLPIPRWDLVDYRRYSYVTAQTSWGCPFGCGYCPYPLTQGSLWRARSVPKVVREFSALRERYGLRFVMLRDPEFSLRRDRTAALCRALSEAGTPILWGCETRLDTLDERLAGAMARAGCVRVAFGVDSVEPRTLAAMGRRALPAARIKEKAAMLKRAGLLTYAMYVVGLPGESESSTRRLIEFACELGSDGASFSMAVPFPGTALEDIGRSSGLIAAAQVRHLTGCVASMGTGYLSPERVQELYLSAKEQWKRSREKSRRESASPLSSPA